MTADSEVLLSDTDHQAAGFDPDGKYPEGLGKLYKKQGPGGGYIRHHQRLVPQAKEERGQGKWKR